jgi:hypothetical protein
MNDRISTLCTIHSFNQQSRMRTALGKHQHLFEGGKHVASLQEKLNQLVLRFTKDINRKLYEYGYSSPLIELKDGERIIGYLSQSQKDDFIDRISRVWDQIELPIEHSMMIVESKGFSLCMDLEQCFSGPRSGEMNFSLDQSMIQDLRQNICPSENGGQPYPVSYRQNVLIVEKPDGTIVFKCGEPQSPKERVKNPHLHIRSRQMGKAIRTQSGSTFQNMKSVSQPLAISEKDRHQLLLPFGRKKTDDYTAHISVSNGKIGSIKAAIGHREAHVSYNADKPGHIFETKSFLRYEADDYEISIHENDGGYWLVTDYESDGAFFQTFEMLDPICLAVPQAMTMEKLAS